MSSKDRRANETTVEYDAAGRRTKATDPLGNFTEWTYDANGNVTKVKETEKIPGSSGTEAFETEFTYDVINRQTKRTEIDRTDSSNKKITEWKRDSRGVLRKTIDAKGNEVEYVADGLGRTLEKREDMGSSQTILTKWTYDDFDRVTKLTDDNNSDTDYAYNVLGQLTQKSYENAKTVSYQYDAGGNVTVITDQSGTEIDQVFNDLDQLVARDLTLASGVGGDTDEDFQYDALGRLTEAKDNDSPTPSM